MDFTALLKQIFGSQPTQVQVGSTVGEGVPGPSKASSFLTALGGLQAPGTPQPAAATTTDQQPQLKAMQLMQALFGNKMRGGGGMAPSFGTGGRADRSGGDGSGGMSGRGSLY